MTQCIVKFLLKKEWIKMHILAQLFKETFLNSCELYELIHLHLL